MEIVKRVIEKKHYSETIFCLKSETINDDSYLIGFKESLPVLSNCVKSIMSTASLQNKDNTKRTVKVETNSQTGEKFIMLNGKKIKILAESELPKTSQFMKLKSLKTINNPSTPVKIKILKGISKKNNEFQQHPVNLPNLLNTSDKNITSQISKLPTNENKFVKLIPVSLGENTQASTVDKSVVTDNTKMLKNDRTMNKPILFNTTVLNNLITQTTISNNHHSVQSAALDLTKNCESQKRNTSVMMKEDKSLQVDIKPTLVNREVQTDDPFDPDLESLIKMDWIDFSLFRDIQTPIPSPAKAITDIDTIETQTDDNTPKQYTTLNTIASKHINGNNLSRSLGKSVNAENFFKELRGTLLADDKGNMPIHIGVITNDITLVKRNLFLLKILKQDVDVRNNNDYSPLQLAVINDSSTDIVNTLLTKGANLHVTDAEGNNVLHYAVEYQRKETLKLILGYACAQKFNLDEHNHEGLTPLMMCCLNNLHDCAELLLEADADPNVKDQISGRTALFHAAEQHDVDMVEMLLQFNACTKIKNFFGTSPHDAMYEIDDMPEQIKFMILGKNKRKLTDDGRPSKFAKKHEISKVGLKTYARLEKVRNNPILKNFTVVK